MLDAIPETRKAKMVIVMRKDLNMRRGKQIAQGCHAAVLAYKVADTSDTAFRSWDIGQFTKICVSVNSEEELLDVVMKAKAARVPVSLITDAGHTEFHGVPTHTCLALGPAWADEIDKISGGLPLL
jgi:peptidyl-tRNA hydrolase, PTH2 family